MSSINLSPTRVYDFDGGQYLTTAGDVAVLSAAIKSERIMVHAVNGAGFFRVGTSVIVATIGAGSIPLAAGEKFMLDVDPGQFLSWIRLGATDCSLAVIGCN